MLGAVVGSWLLHWFLKRNVEDETRLAHCFGHGYVPGITLAAQSIVEFVNGGGSDQAWGAVGKGRAGLGECFLKVTLHFVPNSRSAPL